MAKHFQFILVAVAVALCTAEPIRFRGNRNNRFFARQEEAPSSTAAPAAAPYPPAGVTPAIAFELPTEQTTVQPDNTYLPPAPEPTPDNTYGPPEPTPDNTYGPPDNQYGPPAVDEAPAVAVAVADAATDDLPVVDPRIERIILAQRNQKASRSQLRQQRRRAQALRSSKLQLEPVQIVRSQPVIAYSVQYKSF